MRFGPVVCALFCAALPFAPLSAQDATTTIAANPPAWAAGQTGATAFAAAKGSQGVMATLAFEKGKRGAELVVSGLWETTPLTLRLWVAYTGARAVPLDTYRFAELTELGGKTAYKLTLPPSALRTLKGGDTLVIEDLTTRAEIPLTGSSKAIAAAEAAAGL